MKETEKYEEQLKKIQQPDSFKVPEGYFDELPENVMKTIDLLEGKRTSKKNPFSTPENYFNALPNEIAEKVSAKKSKPLFKRAEILIPLACAMLLIGFLIFRNDDSLERKRYYTIDEIENSTYLQTIDEELLIEELASIPSNAEPADSLLQFMIENNIELSDLENAL